MIYDDISDIVVSSEETSDNETFYESEAEVEEDVDSQPETDDVFTVSLPIRDKNGLLIRDEQGSLMKQRSKIIYNGKSAFNVNKFVKEQESPYLFSATVPKTDYMGKAIRDDEGNLIKQRVQLINYGKMFVDIQKEMEKREKENLKEKEEQRKQEKEVENVKNKLKWKNQDNTLSFKEKDNDYFPMLTVENLTKIQKELNENEWQVKEVKKRNTDNKSVSNKSTTSHTNLKTRFCLSVIRKTECPHRACRFAHKEDELDIIECEFGEECKYIRYDYKKNKICERMHPFETKESFFNRVLRKKPENKVKENKVKEIKVKENKVKENKVKEIKVKENKVKEIKIAKEDPKKVYINRRNTKFNEIRTVSVSVKRLEETFQRYKEQKLDVTSIKAQITLKQDKLKKLNIEYDEITLQRVTKEIDDNYKQQMEEIKERQNKDDEEKNKKIEKEIEDKKREEEEKKIKQQEKENIKVTLITTTETIKFSGWNGLHPLIVNKVETKVKEAKVDKNDWIDVKHSQPNVGNTKTQLCKTFYERKNCPYGKNCKFAHSIKELKVSDCAYGSKCKMVQTHNKKYINRFEKKCCYKHPNEMYSDFCIRLSN